MWIPCDPSDLARTWKLILGLTVYIIPALLRIGSIRATNLFFTCVNIHFCTFMFVTSRLKLVRQGKRKDRIK